MVPLRLARLRERGNQLVDGGVGETPGVVDEISFTTRVGEVIEWRYTRRGAALLSAPSASKLFSDHERFFWPTIIRWHVTRLRPRLRSSALGLR